MRLTADLIQNSLSYLNPLNDRELDLRGALLKRADTVPWMQSGVDINLQYTTGHKIPAIENLGVAKVSFSRHVLSRSLSCFTILPNLLRTKSAEQGDNRTNPMQSTLQTMTSPPLLISPSLHDYESFSLLAIESTPFTPALRTLYPTWKRSSLHQITLPSLPT